MARVTGIGGIFLRARDPKALAAWYVQHLGIQLSEHGHASFLWSDEVPPTTGTTRTSENLIDRAIPREMMVKIK